MITDIEPEGQASSGIIDGPADADIGSWSTKGYVHYPPMSSIVGDYIQLQDGETGFITSDICGPRRIFALKSSFPK